MMADPGDLYVNLATGEVEFDDGPRVRIIKDSIFIHIAVSGPSSAENKPLLIAVAKLEIVTCRSVLVGSSSPSVTWQLRHGTSRSAAGDDVLDGNATTTSTTTPETDETMLNPKIEAGESLWLVTTAIGGSVDEFGLTVLARWRK